MIFDFDKFAKITASVYPVSPYTLEEALSVFRYFFTKYEKSTQRPHPPLKASQIVRIIQDMPYIDHPAQRGAYVDIKPEDYPELIDQYFKTPFRSCDYRINHFFSGRVRELRFFEKLYHE